MQTEPMQYLRRKMEEEHGQEGIGAEIGTGEGNTEGEDALAGEVPPEDNAVSQAPEGEQLPPEGELPGDVTPPRARRRRKRRRRAERPEAQVRRNFGEFEESAKKYAAACAKKKKYEAKGSAEQSGKNPLPAGSGSVEETVGPSNNGSTSGESQTGVGQTGKEGGAVKYSALESRLRELESDRAKRIDAERVAVLQRLSYHRIFDFDKEVERCKYAKKNGMSDAAFKEHCDMIVENYQPVGAAACPSQRRWWIPLRSPETRDRPAPPSSTPARPASRPCSTA